MLKKIALTLLLIVVVTLTILTCWATPPTEAIPDDSTEATDTNTPLTFAQVSDVHLDFSTQPTGKRLLSQSRKLLEKTVETLNRMQVDFVVFSGDSINSPREKNLAEFTRIASGLHCPWYVALGNHDISIGGNLNKKKFARLLGQQNSYQKDAAYFSIVPKPGFVLIILDGVMDRESTNHGYFNSEQLDWLDQQLTRYQDSAAIIVQHFPVIEPFRSLDHDVINAQEYLNTIAPHHNLAAVLSGHYHTAKTTRRGSITHISTPALVEAPSRFRLVKLKKSPSGIHVETELISFGGKAPHTP